jgi:lysozyme
METTEQFSQSNTIFSTQNPSAAMLKNCGSVLSCADLQTNSPTQLADSTAKLNLPETDPTKSLQSVKQDIDVTNQTEQLQARSQSRVASANGSTGTTQPETSLKTTGADRLTGIAEGAALTGAYKQNVSSQGQSILKVAIGSAQKKLASFATDETFLDKMNLAFGEDWQGQDAQALIQSLAKGETMPEIEIVSETVLDAKGAYGQNTIYLSDKFLSENLQNPEVVSTVLLEEIGHAVDQKLNQVDSPGDEGDIFSRLVENKTIRTAELKTLKAEDDSSTIALHGQAIDVELRPDGPINPLPPNHLLIYKPGIPLKFDKAVEQWQQEMRDDGWKIAADGFYGPKSKKVCIAFQKKEGLAADGIVGPKTWNASFGDDTTSKLSSGSGTSNINSRGLDLIKHAEGLRLKAYKDPGRGILTIGYGHTGSDVDAGDVISKTKATQLLKSDLDRFESTVGKLVKVPLTSNQFSAVVSLTYNIGEENFGSSTLLKRLNQNKYQGAANEFPRWNKSGNKVLPGLVKRRAKERALFLSG